MQPPTGRSCTGVVKGKRGIPAVNIGADKVGDLTSAMGSAEAALILAQHDEVLQSQCVLGTRRK